VEDVVAGLLQARPHDRMAGPTGQLLQGR
jgi:hypothetical protein